MNRRSFLLGVYLALLIASVVGIGYQYHFALSRSKPIVRIKFLNPELEEAKQEYQAFLPKIGSLGTGISEVQKAEDNGWIRVQQGTGDWELVEYEEFDTWDSTNWEYHDSQGHTTSAISSGQLVMVDG